MRAKILAGCLAALVVLRLLLSSGEPRPGRPLPVDAAAEDDDTPLTQRAWADLAEASPQTEERAYAASPNEDEDEDDFAEDWADARADSGDRVQRYAEALFRRLDQNGDGLLDVEEMTTALRANLSRFDTDEDGVIDLREFLAYFRARVALFRAGAAAPAPPPSPLPLSPGGRGVGVRGADRLPTWLSELDTDQDGQIALHEWRAAGRPVEEFQRLDRNGDGFLTPREVASADPPATPPAQSPLTLAGSTNSLPGRGDDRTATRGGVLYNQSVGGLVLPPSPKGTAPTTADRIEQQHVAAAAAPPRAASPAPVKAATRPAAAPAPAPAPPPPALPAAATASTILNGTNPYWAMREQQNELLLQQGPAKVLFLGDSITDFLESGPGQPVWDAFFAPLGAEDFAIAGLTTSQVLWQVETGEVALAAPKVVVLMIGTNNIGLGQTPQDTAAGITQIVDQIHAQLPVTRILLLGLLPRGQNPDDPLRAKVAQVNALIAGLDGNGTTFLDIGADFLQPDGTLSPTVMPDFLHPSQFGYQIYTLAIWETLMALLAEG